MNIVGWSSGIDGQMPGFVTITTLTLGAMSLRFSAHDISQTVVAALAFITAGAFLGFLPWNFYPQKIMPGYGGKTLAGLMIATIAILSGGKIGSALIILAVPMLDALYSLVRRLAHKKSPFQADRAHLHHRLLDLGWGKRRIALFYWTVSAILGLLTLYMNSEQKFFTFVALTVSVGGILLWFSLMFKKTKTGNSS
jgi:UDP-GlcNAc:undecaprenyl-phosphate GlcNAc-1-phosphate transferase